MKVFLLSFFITISGCYSAVIPNYIVRHSSVGSDADIRELRISTPTVKFFATISLPLIFGISNGAIKNRDSGHAADFAPAMIDGVILGFLVGAGVDSLLAALGLYSGHPDIYTCKNLLSSHKTALVPKEDLRELLEQLNCKKLGYQF
jgi:hypothetical protein